MIRRGITELYQHLKIGVVGAPFNHGQVKTGVRDGPTVLRRTGFIKQLEHLGYDVIDDGDILPTDGVRQTGPSGEKNHNIVLEYNEQLASIVANFRKDDRLSLTLGGDHSIGIGTIAGHSQGTPHKQLVVLWVDAHADINTGRSSSSGNMHGMPISYLLKEMRNKVNRLPGNEWPQPSIEAKHLAYIGLRSIDAAEEKFFNELDILHFGMRDLDKIGLQEAIAQCMDRLQPTESRSLHCSFDIDAIDPIEAPCTGTPVRGGLTLREGISIAEAAHDTGRLRGFDLVEVNPSIGTVRDNIRTTEAANAILLAAACGSARF